MAWSTGSRVFRARRKRSGCFERMTGPRSQIRRSECQWVGVGVFDLDWSGAKHRRARLPRPAMALRGTSLLELLSDLRKDLGAEQFDALQERRLWHASDVHLEDLAPVAEQFVEMKDPVGDFVRAPEKYHAAALVAS